MSIEQGEGGGTGSRAAPQSGGNAPSEQGADASSGALKEAFSVQIRVDLADRVEGATQLPVELGIAPEVAALGELLYPAESEAAAPSDRDRVDPSAPQRWTVLFVWGRKRVYPIRITGMTINETSHNAELNPVRAEIEVAAEVLSEADARDNVAVSSALEFTASNRRQLAQASSTRPRARSSNILRL